MQGPPEGQYTEEQETGGGSLHPLPQGEIKTRRNQSDTGQCDEEGPPMPFNDVIHGLPKMHMAW